MQLSAVFWKNRKENRSPIGIRYQWRHRKCYGLLPDKERTGGVGVGREVYVVRGDLTQIWLTERQCCIAPRDTTINTTACYRSRSHDDALATTCADFLFISLHAASLPWLDWWLDVGRRQAGG